MPNQVYKLKKPLEYGGKLINEIAYDDDPDELTPAQLQDIDLSRLTVIGEVSKSIAAVTRQPIELIESLKMSDWGELSRRTQEVLGNAMELTQPALLPTSP